MNNYKILWLDDQINQSYLSTHIIQFALNNCDVVRFEEPDSFLNYIEDEENKPDEVGFVILDVSMPIGEKLSKEHITDNFVGKVILEKLKKSTFGNIPKMIYTNMDNQDTKDYCTKEKIPYVDKAKVGYKELVEWVMSIISKKMNEHE